MNLQQTIKKEITIGVLTGAMCLTLVLWFLAYNQEKSNTFLLYTVSAEYLD